MKLSELISFIDSCPHVLNINTSSLLILMESKVSGAENFTFYQNMLTTQIFGIEKKEQANIWLCAKFPSDWVSLGQDRTDKFIQFLELQKNQLKTNEEIKIDEKTKLKQIL